MRILCFFGYHKWEIISVDKYEKFMMYAKCRRCDVETILYAQVVT